jgi:hypothetical protein
MHRSGTSLVASWLERCGLRIDAGRRMGPAIGNPWGHFEDQDFVDLHEAAIRRLDPASAGWKYAPGDFLAFTGERRAVAGALVRRRNELVGPWGWKDPRSTLFLTQWREIVPDLKVLAVWRPCAEVVHSLARRSKQAGFPELEIGAWASVRLWQAYNRRLCAYRQQVPDDTLLFEVGHILRHGERVLDLLNDRFQLGLGYVPLETVFAEGGLDRSPPLAARLLSASLGSRRLQRALQRLSDRER